METAQDNSNEGKTNEQNYCYFCAQAFEHVHLLYMLNVIALIHQIQHVALSQLMFGTRRAVINLK